MEATNSDISLISNVYEKTSPIDFLVFQRGSGALWFEHGADAECLTAGLSLKYYRGG